MTPEIENFLRSLLDPEQFGFAVTGEVRDQARRLLGMEPVETIKPRQRVGFDLEEM